MTDEQEHNVGRHESQRKAGQTETENALEAVDILILYRASIRSTLATVALAERRRSA